MKTLVWNLVLAIGWCAITGRLTVVNLMLGFAIGYLALRPPAAGERQPRYFRKLRQAFEFGLFFVREIALSTLRVARDVLTPRPRMRPAVLAVPLDVESDAEITLFANVITLTPGTLTLDLSPDCRTLYVHKMFVDDADEAVRGLKSGFERRVLELMR
ncbi:MAG TPA: Na+/H+ antiporter subunit E [Sandaracinaceae bacterium LLY-WYZ-13_1]|nr:Na+/H+ antiporter subunit E [Sandaracinaceae bacterium LLY-WYZ-13_1]